MNIEYKFDTSVRIVDSKNTLNIVPTITLNRTLKKYAIRVISNDMPENVIHESMTHQLADTIAEQLAPSILRNFSVFRDNMLNEEVSELRVNLVLPDEKLLYGAKEKMLVQMAENANVIIGCQSSEIDSLKLTISRYEDIEQSFLKRLKFLFGNS